MNTKPMNEARAREVLGEAISSKDGVLDSLGWYLSWTPNDNNACLDGDFTAEDLEAIAWWMRNMGRESPREQFAASKPPVCEDCNEPMSRYTESPDTGKDGWVCLSCGWSLDD